MEALTRLVADSLARHGFDRPVDPRRLQWSRWFRCDSTHSLLVVPSKPGIFSLAEEIMDLGSTVGETALLRRSESNPQPPSSSPAGTAFISPGRKSGVSDPPRNRVPQGRHQFRRRCPQAHARRPPVLRRRRHGLHSRPHVHPLQPPARALGLWTLLPALRSHRRPGPAPQHLQRPKPMDALLRRKSLRHRRRFPVIAGVDRLRSHSPCGSDTPVRQCRHRSNSSPRNKGRTSVGYCTAGPESGFRSQPESSLSSPPPLRLLNREGFSTGRRSPKPVEQAFRPALGRHLDRALAPEV